MGIRGFVDRNSTSEVTSSANITDHAVVRGDGGALGIQGSGVLIDDSDNISGLGSIASTGMTLDPGASGDSTVQFDINTTNEFIMGVDDTDDSFRISQGSALGTNDTFVMTAAGERTMPLQPAFLATASTQSDVTGDGTTYTVQFGTVVYDQNSDYDGTSTFTAPVTGRYLFSAIMQVHNDATGGLSNVVKLVASNRTIVITNLPTENQVTNYVGVNGHVTVGGTMSVDMDASDTVTITWQSGSNSKADDVISGTFSGYLVC